MPKLSLKAALVRGSLITYLSPKLAQDAKVDISPLLRGITSKNYASKRNELLGGVTNLVKDKLAKKGDKFGDEVLAKDAELDHLPELLEALEKEENEEGMDDGELRTPSSSATPGKSREFLAGKLSSEDMATYDEMCKDEVKPGVNPNSREEEQGIDEETDEEKKAKEAKEAKDAEEEEMKKKDEKAKDRKAMDALVKDAIDGERQRQRDVREAEKAFRPHLGEIAMSFDSAEEVYRHGLKAMGIKRNLDNVPLTALQAILESQPAPNSRREKVEVAMDAGAVDSFQKRFKTAVQPKQLG